MDSTLTDFLIECFEAYAQLGKYIVIWSKQLYMHACFVTVARLLHQQLYVGRYSYIATQLQLLNIAVASYLQKRATYISYKYLPEFVNEVASQLANHSS